MGLLLRIVVAAYPINRASTGNPVAVEPQAVELFERKSSPFLHQHYYLGRSKHHMQ